MQIFLNNIYNNNNNNNNKVLPLPSSYWPKGGNTLQKKW